MFSNPPISPFRKGGVNMFITYLKIKIYEITTTNRHSRGGGNPCFSRCSMDPQLLGGDGTYPALQF
jgi:hypothetical protein